MTENELFEQWFWNDNLDDYNKPEYEMGLRAWNAHAELANKQIAELQAQVNELRKALEDISKLPYTSYKWGTIAAQALAKTAPKGT